MTEPPRPPLTGLPVEDAVGPLRRALAARGAAVLEAPPGAGKTTVVPLRLLGEPWLGRGRILVLEPRRLATRAAAQRMAELLGEPVGAVGYRTGDDSRTGRDVRIEVVTEAILVRMVQDDPALDGVGLVVLDEVHERNLATDLSLALLVDARSALRPDLRLLAMSATADAERTASLLGDAGRAAPVVRSAGRSHPVEVAYDPAPPGVRLDAHVARAIGSVLARHPHGDVLVFLPGASDIRRVEERLGGGLGADTDVLPLFGALAGSDQDAALRPSPPGRRRVVLATDIAESSLTVAGVRIVVDAGLVRVPRHDPASALTRLQTEPASIASADQRAGRAGRLGPGLAVRLWDRAEQSRRPHQPVPEIAVADLAGFALEVALWGAPVEDLALADLPPPAAWADALASLRTLGALDAGGRPSARGRAMAALPLHPRLAALALVARDAGIGPTGAVLAAVLEEGDVLRGRPGAVPVDLAVRVDLVARRDAHHPDLDRAALRRVRRRADQVARRIGVGRGPVDLEAIGRLVAAAHPERIAQAGGGGGYRLRAGGGGALAATDPLAGSAYLAVARVEPGPRGPEIRLAAHLDDPEVAQLVASDVVVEESVAWDPERDDLRATRTRRAGALVLERRSGPAEAGPAATAALVEQIRATEGALLRWSDRARRLQGRLAFLHAHDPDGWPDVGDAALLATLEDWLVPMVPGARSRADIDRVDLAAALEARLDPDQRRQLHRLAPESFDAPSGRSIAITYSDDGARAATRVQDLYGTSTHPSVLDGRVPVVLELLSPAQRPIQITADLAGFWTGSWAEVRKELAGRYPKHAWPLDPSAP